ncbi:MAG: hypothetical protein ABI132_00210, partial [Rhodanobacteraceae bacterium]
MCCIGLTACGSGTPSGNAPSAGQLYSATLSLQGQPAVTADGKDIQVTVAVNNTGSASFGSATSPHNVNLAAHSIDASGHVINNDLA